MNIVDTGPLVATIDADDPYHTACVGLLSEAAAPLVTTWPVVAEAMHLLGRRQGWRAQELLWRPILRAGIQVDDLNTADCRRMARLMEIYHRAGMDLADASLVVLVERYRRYRILSLDSDFFIYRAAGNRAITPVSGGRRA